MDLRHLRTAFAAVCVSACVAAAACSGGSDGSRIGRGGSAETTTTRAPLIPPGSYDALRQAKDPNSFLDAFGALGVAGSNIPPDALAAVAVGPVAMDFLALVTRIQHEDYSVAYRLRGKSVSAVPGDSFLTIVHTPGDQKTEVQAGSVTAAQFVDGTSVIACTKVAAWECKPSPQPVSTPVGAEALLYFLGLVVQNPGAFDTKTYQTDIVGVPVNCIRADPIEAAGEIGLIEVCVTAEGVPLRGVVPDLTLDGVWYTPSVDPADLVPPA
ncbi:MAG: hypothetical protein K1X95_15315 [Acidimicrobiia bacterium]|nr:hypothetical protein [Acidimicrobiia bacterium]